MSTMDFKTMIIGQLTEENFMLRHQLQDAVEKLNAANAELREIKKIELREVQKADAAAETEVPAEKPAEKPAGKKQAA